ncbi:hypothetical protein AB0D62_37615 [Streptomyces massasporeus]
MPGTSYRQVVASPPTAPCPTGDHRTARAGKTLLALELILGLLL